MARILVTEQLAERGLAAMRAGGHDVEVQVGLNPEQLLDAVAGAAALVVRSATAVTAAVLEAGTQLVVKLKYIGGKTSALSGIRRISRPGLRVYARKTEIPRVLGGLGLVVLSTSEGVMSGRAANKAGLGGEVLCYVW